MSVPERRAKYGNVPRDAQGRTRAECAALGIPWQRVHDSTREARRHWELERLQEQGLISELRCHWPTFTLAVNGVLIARYTPDHSYVEHGQRVIEDSKGVRTRDYQIKRKLMRALYQIEIRET